MRCQSKKVEMLTCPDRSSSFDEVKVEVMVDCCALIEPACPCLKSIFRLSTGSELRNFGSISASHIRLFSRSFCSLSVVAETKLSNFMKGSRSISLTFVLHISIFFIICIIFFIICIIFLVICIIIIEHLQRLVVAHGGEGIDELEMSARRRT